MKSFLLIIFISLIITLNCSFQLSLFNEINKRKKGQNLIISPLSIFQILSLTANGAKDKTQLEMVQTLQNEDIEDLNSINYEILEIFKNFTTVEIANAVMSKFLPTQQFLDISEKYCAPYQELISAQQVNNWCDEKTHGKISKIIDELDSAIQMILINAVYFKGTWKNTFNEKFTEKKDFYNKGIEIKQIDTMSQLSSFLYYEDNKLQAIELPYMKDDMSALIILPRENIDINKYIASLNSEENSLNDLIQKLKYSKVKLELPKFELEFFSSLKETLSDMGIETAFTDFANFTGLREEGNLKIDDVLHKTYLKVNENGTEAAAVTAVTVRTTSAKPVHENIYLMKINKPFLFFLRSKKLPLDNDLLFMSKIEIIGQ
jgi:serpin B